MDLQLFPVPRRVSVSDACVDFSRARWVRVAPAFTDVLRSHVIDFAAAAGFYFNQPLQATAGQPAAGQVFLTVELDSSLGEQSYRLRSRPEQAVTLEAGDNAGAFYGLETLRQILEQCGSRLPELEITDSPDFPQRGVMLDVSRCKVPTMQNLFSLIDLFATLKLNQFQLYMEHTFQFSAHESVWYDATPFTAEQILELDRYCRERYIQLVPNFNSFGHFERWLRHPQYRHLAECPDGFTTPWGRHSTSGSTLKPNDDSSAFLDLLYKEFLPNFSSPLFNVGCDETWELGKGWSKTRCEELGTTRVYVDFLLEINKLLGNHGRRMMFWGDIILHNPELIQELPQDVIGLVWGYEADHPFDKQCQHFAESGLSFYVCPGTSSWNSLTGRTENCLGNLASAAEHGHAAGAVGFLNTDWGDGGHHQYQPLSYLGYCAGAAYSWCFEANRDVDIRTMLDQLVFKDSAGVLGMLFHELGKVLELLPTKSVNSSHFGRWLFADLESDTEALKQIDPAALGQCISRFDELESAMHEAAPQAADGQLIKAELKNAIAMARFSVKRIQLALGIRNDAAQMQHELQHIISVHEDLWLARNRRGGLRESSDRLRNIIVMN